MSAGAADPGPLQTTLLAVAQGLTEFLPVSSSAHLLLPSILLGWPDQGLTFDVAVHAGTLLAALAYFRRDLRGLGAAWIGSLAGRPGCERSRLAWLLLLASVPVGAAGLALGGPVEALARSAPVIAAASIAFGILLWLADRIGRDGAGLERLGWRGALVIGLFQALALIPGASRAGVTMTAALFCGLSRRAAARFSFLLAIPVILASGLLRAGELAASGQAAAQWPRLLYGGAVSALVAFATIHFFLRLVERLGLAPFAVYRIALGALLLGLHLAA